MSRKSRRAESEIEGPFKTPEQLKLAMPLIAMIGMMAVVSAIYVDTSRPIVALIAVGGFGLCATAPMALIDLYVTRPLRAALAQIRAARDGKAGEASFASGAVADLVHLARDVHTAQANLGASGELFEQYERLIAASEDVARSVRRAPEDAPSGDGAMEPAAQADIAALAEAMKALRAAPAAGLDGAVERLEAMLVYIAETLDRVEAKDRQIEGGVGQLGLDVADLARLVARDTQTLQGEMSSGGLNLRADVAGVDAEERLGRTRLLERIDALEARLIDRASPPDARLGDDLRGLVETIARHVKTLAPGAIVDALQSQRTAGENMRAEIGDLAAAVSRLAEAAPSSAVEALRGELGRVEAALLARTQADESAADDLAVLRIELNALVATATKRIEESRGDLTSTEAGLDRLGEAMAERWSAETEAQARRLDGIERRVVEQIVAIGRENDAKTTAALLTAADGIGEAARRLDAAGARGASDEDVRAFAEAETRMIGGLAEVVARFDAFEAWALAGASHHFGGAQARIEEAAAKIDASGLRLAEVAEATAQLQARIGDAAPANEALTQAMLRFEAAQSRLAGAVAAAPQEVRAEISALTSVLRARTDDLAARADAARTGDLFEAAQAIGALGQILPAVARDFGDTQARWRTLVCEFEAATQKLTALAETDASRAAADWGPAVEALRGDFARTAAEAAAKFDAAAQDLTRTVEDRVEMLRRGELWPAIVAAQTTAQELHSANAGLFTQVESLKSALLSDRSGFAALRLDVGEASAKVAAVGERMETERAELGALSQTLARTGQRVETSTRALEQHNGDLAARLQKYVTEAIEANTARLAGLERRLGETSAPLDPQALADLRGEVAVVRAALEAAETKPRVAADPKTSGAVARLVVSMAEALDSRFSNIETALGDLTNHLQAPEDRPGGNKPDAGLSMLARDLRSASEALKSGLSEFVGASAALAKDVAVAEGAPRMTIAA